MTEEEIQELFRQAAAAEAARQSPSGLDLRPQQGESREAYRARVEQGREVDTAMRLLGEDSRNAGTQAADAEALAALTAPPELNTWDKYVRPFQQGLTFGFGDEMTAGIGALMGADYDTELARERSMLERASNEAPIASTVSEIGGALIPAAASLPYAAGKTLAGTVMRGMGIGAAEGALAGFGGGEGGFVNRAVGDGSLGGLAGSAVGMGTIGAALGGAIPAVAGVAGEGVRSVRDWSRRGAIGREVGGALDIQPSTANVLVERFAGESPDAMNEALLRAGPNAMLADATGSGVQTLDSVLRQPTQGAALAAGRVDQRAGQSGNALAEALMGGNAPVGYRESIAQVGDRYQNISPLYRQAYETAIDPSTPEAAAIMDLLNRLPRSTTRSAIESANEAMRYEGIPSQIMAQIADDGTVTFQGIPNVMQLDQLKRAFNGIAEAGIGPDGRMTPEGRFAANVARDIRNATREAVPAYGDALNEAAGAAGERSAINVGRTALSNNTYVEDIAEAVSGATGAELEAMRQGLRGEMMHILGNVRMSPTNQNIDVQQAIKEFGMMTSPNSQAKLEMIFQDEWPELLRMIEEAGPALGLRARTAANAATFGRGATDQAITDANPQSLLLRGKPIQAAQNTVAGVFGVSDEAIKRMGLQTRSELADVLTRQGGTPRQALDAVTAALMQHPYVPTWGQGTERALRNAGLTGVPAALMQMQEETR